MNFDPSDLIELYAYKVDDLAAGREPRGGRGSVLRLRRSLLEARLPGPLAKRFREVDRRWRELQGTEPAGPTAPEPEPEAPQLDLGIVDLPLEEEAVEGAASVQGTLQALAEDVYWASLQRDLKRLVRSLVSGQRYELRLAYAFLQNFEAYAAQPDFARDFNLSKFQLAEPIPTLSDPLVTLDDDEVASALMREVFQIGLRLGDGRTYPLPLPPEGVIPYIRRFLRRIIETPQALPVPNPGGGPSTEELRAALDEARRSALTAHEREQLVRDLQEKLREAAAQERRLRMVAEEDRRRFMAAAERLSAILRRYLPTPRGEATMPVVPEPMAESEAGPKLNELPRDAAMVTLRRAPTRLVMAGVPLTLGVAGEHTQITVGNVDHALQEGEPLRAPYENWEVWAFLRDDYVHIRLEMREGAQLSALLSEGRVLAHLVHPHRDYAYLRLLRAFSARLKGPVNYEEYGVESAEKFPEASHDTLEAFARKGLRVVKERLQRTPGGLKLMREVATSLGMESEGQKLLRVLSDWLNFRPPTRETMGGDLGVSTVSGEPVNIQAGNLVLSVRQTDEAVYVGAAGAVPRKLGDLMIWPLDDGAVVIAREGVRLAHTQVKVV
ncbi:MAG TPA: hypothetical protein ENK37_07965 [Oceanithermus profundus]|uniref:Uncharacterized protein n=1 Tax=Oceanithermus profundus TaxID=187137 RepID=A0A7C4V6L5_9DEIN|nr:hypothetical protein [Oceanithermus profundus]